MNGMPYECGSSPTRARISVPSSPSGEPCGGVNTASHESSRDKRVHPSEATSWGTREAFVRGGLARAD
eukprot:8526562-Pyramimonas_sp.AAC.1